MSAEADVGEGRQGTVERASGIDTLRIFGGVMLPTFGKGILIRRPTMEAAAERIGFDTRAVKTMQYLRRKYGPAPLLLAVPGRPQLLLFDPRDVARILNGSPRPFRTDTKEKRAALNHFEPGNVLVADPNRRAALRTLHEAALATSSTVHPFVSRFREVIRHEYRDVMRGGNRGEISWPMFAAAWFRMVRRIVLGDRARDDEDLTNLLNSLRRRANWAFFLPQDRAGRRHLHERLQQYLAVPEKGSLVSMMPADARCEPSSQIAQWLFAFDPAGMTTFRTLALLACHRQFADRAREEALKDRVPEDTRQSFIRRCVLESLRLWPTTPAILREATEDVQWDDRLICKGTGIIVFTPFFGRDDEKLDFAHKMSPDIWQRSQNDALAELGIIPFSDGPAICPAHNLVPLLDCLVISAVLAERELSLIAPKLDPERLPGTLNHFGIRLAATELSNRGTALS
jgi:cytochrome P450